MKLEERLNNLNGVGMWILIIKLVKDVFILFRSLISL